jgi:hypothetical protein
MYPNVIFGISFTSETHKKNMRIADWEEEVTWRKCEKMRKRKVVKLDKPILCSCDAVIQQVAMRFSILFATLLSKIQTIAHCRLLTSHDIITVIFIEKQQKTCTNNKRKAII